MPGLGGADPALAERLAIASRAHGGEGERYTNRLILETSPYLLQHAHNPVNWYPWGDEAFARARREGKPVLLSVGYATCHWCHVMEAESFQDEEIARTLNERYVAIKVDREERPEVDSLYLDAVELLSGRGGWPMTLVLTPDRQPFFAATYLPARDGDRGAGKGFLTILRELSDSYRKDPARAVATAGEVTRRLQEAAAAPPPATFDGPAALRRAASALARAFDADHGGFGRAPKFPMVTTLSFLARYHRHTGDPQALHMFVHTLERLAAGGIRDHVGGGFHRYSVDARWIVPHFERMLYDNAGLAAAYLEAWQLTGRADFLRTARGVLAWMDRDLSLPSGAFAGASDADSPGEHGLEEGRYFTWTPGELAAALGPERARAATTFFGVTDRGHVDGRSVLYDSMPLERAAGLLGVSSDALAADLDGALVTLGEVRARRPPPRRDDKAITAWNGLAISAFARAALATGDAAYAARAARAAEAVLGEPLPRTRPGDRPALLDDRALLAAGLLDLHEATGDPRWLAGARAQVDALERDFADERGGFWRTPRGGEALLARDKPTADSPEPSGNAAAILVLLRLHELTGDDRYRETARRALEAFAAPIQRGEGAALLSALDFYLDTPLQIVLVAPEGQRPVALQAVVARTFVPNRVLVVAAEGAELADRATAVPLLAEKRALHGLPTAYVCRMRSCENPTSDPAVLATQLARVTPLLAR